MRIQDFEITNDRCRPLALKAFGYYNAERHEVKTEPASAIQAVKKLKNELVPVREHQAQYYQALQRSTSQMDCAPFIALILRMILHAVSAAATLQVAPQVTPQVVHLL